MLKYETNEVPTGLESYYEDAGNGVFKLKVEGVVPATEYEKVKGSVKEFRDNNIKLKKTVDDLSTFEQMFKTGEFSQEKLTARIEQEALKKAAEMKAAFEERERELSDKLNGTTSRLEQIVVDKAVTEAALKHGVSETALEDVFSRAKTTFTVVDGQLTAKDGALDAKGNKLSVDGWMATLAEKAPHLFKASSGASAAKPGRPVPQETQRSAVDLISAGLAKRR